MSKLTSMLLGIVLMTAGLPLSARAQNVITGTIATDQPGPTISRNIQGQFSEHLGRGIYDGIWVGPDSSIPNTHGIRNDVVAALKAIKMPVVRWPGGCFADIYNWRDGIGPRDKRPLRKNEWWGGLETNQFGTHEFFDFAEQTGSNTYVAINMATATPGVMREWMDYITSRDMDSLAQERRANGHAAPFKLGFVGIGNEAWGCGGAQTPEYFSDNYRRFATYFHSGTAFQGHDDNAALRVASGPNNDDTHWMEVVLKNAGPMMDAISLHYYTVWHGDWTQRNTASALNITPAAWNEILYQAWRMDGVLRAHEAVMDKIDPEKRIGLFVDEWGTWYAPEPGTVPSQLYQQNTLRDALVAGETLNIFHAHAARVRMANIAQTVNVLQAMLLTDGAKMAKTPTYYAFAMYVPFQDATFLPVHVTAPQLTAESGRFPAFTLSAAKGKDGHIHVAIANADKDHAVRLALDLVGEKAKTVSGQILTAPQLDAHNTPGEPEQITPQRFMGGGIKGNTLLLDIPAKSLVVVQVE